MELLGETFAYLAGAGIFVAGLLVGILRPEQPPRIRGRSARYRPR